MFIVEQFKDLYLDGATPTKFGPNPRKSDLGPSFSRIDLQKTIHGF